MIKIKNSIQLFIIFLSLFINAQSTWHVTTTGSDSSGDGSLGNPYATLQKAGQQVLAGDTVLVHEGTYRNSDFNDGDIWDGDNLLKITANGMAGDYITFKPFPGDAVLLEFDSTYGILISNSSYIIIEGFDVKGINNQIDQAEADAAWGLYKDTLGVIHDLADELGIDINDPAITGTSVVKTSTPGIDKPSYYNGRGIVANSSHHITIKNNTVRGIPSSAIRCQQSDYVTISENVVYDNTFWTTQGVGAITVAEATPTPAGDANTGVKIVLEKNYVHHNENRLISWNPTKTFVKMVIDEGTGLFLTRNRDTYTNGYIMIVNNILSYNGASGIVSHFTDRVIIEHNTIFKNGTTNESAAGGIGINNTDDVTIRNNISYAEPDHWALGTLAQPNTNLNVTNNLLYNENGTEDIDNNIATGWTEANPLFNDAANGDFSLMLTSPAINNGSTSGTQSLDFNGDTRDANPDIGALEYDNTLALEENSLNDKILMYPNPTRASLYFNIKNADIKNGNIQVFDNIGRLVQVNSIIGPQMSIELNGPAGIYLVKIKNNESTEIKRAIKI